MKIQSVLKVFLCVMVIVNVIQAQSMEEEEIWTRTKKKETITPKSVDFFKMWEEKEQTKEDFEIWKRQREAKIKERLEQSEALEKAVDPDKYIVGPGDIFSFNIWGIMEEQVPLPVSPEGKLSIPSVGDILVDGKSLSEVHKLVLSEAEKSYKNSKVTLVLESLRFFRIHVTGEVEFPGTYLAQATDRISEMITEAGGTTEWAWKRKIELKHNNEIIDYFDLADFEQSGNVDEDLYVNGGDIIYVPPINLENNLVHVQGDIKSAGIYQIFENEDLLDFLQRIRAMKKNTDLSKISVIRENETKNTEKTIYFPFVLSNDKDSQFPLQNNDKIILPSNYVYVKGTVSKPGAYPYVLNMKARDYAGMAGSDYRSGSIKAIKVYHIRTGKTEKGQEVLVEPGDIVEVPQTFELKFREILGIVSTFAYFVIAAASAGAFD
jgi:protein involved in polysaccharide export with SLBB domain